MAWRRPGDKPLSHPMMGSVLTHICVTRPHWVKMCYWCCLMLCFRQRVVSFWHTRAASSIALSRISWSRVETSPAVMAREVGMHTSTRGRWQEWMTAGEQMAQINIKLENCGNSIALVMKLLQYCAKPLIWPGIGIPIIKIRLSWDSLVITVGIPLLCW